ncbi:hypothetical protein O181_049541 [Austropuccinia psidii MF-1]|uniref:SGNH hydrolase-type esterase domain-containing protein n=1 Tax=Austropuccinia psidii MF-1 TaxID=1389203 RepID=A0A9Q3E039_9BASI|nr:hypothetical protein [Austropuccinia psidii MF-1]
MPLGPQLATLLKIIIYLPLIAQVGFQSLHPVFRIPPFHQKMVSVDLNEQNLQATTSYEPFSMDQFVMFGDSITQFAWGRGGLGSDLAHAYQRKLDVVNRGFSGYNTVWGLEVAKIIFPIYSPPIQIILPKKRIVTIWFGANDAVIPPKPQTVSPEQFSENLNKLVEIVQEHDRQTSSRNSPPVQIILITPPPVSIEMRAADCAARFPDWKPENMDRDSGRTKMFAELVCQVAKEKGLPVVDIWTAITKASEAAAQGLGEYLSDGLHLTSAGYNVVWKELMNLILRHFPHLSPQEMKQDFPWWNDINFEHPEKSFPHPGVTLT